MCYQSNVEKCDKEESFRIYDFLKKKPELLIGGGSGFLAVLASLLALCNYISEQAMVRYWNVDTVYINISTPERIYSTVGSFAWMCLAFLIFSVIMSVAEQTSQISYIKKYLRCLRYRCKWEQVKMRMKKVLHKVFPSVSAKIKYDYTCKKADKIKVLKQKLWESNSSRRKQHMVQVILFEILLTPVLVVWVHTELGNSLQSMGIVFLVAVFISTIMIGMMYFAAYCSTASFKKVKMVADNDYKKGDINSAVPDMKFPLMILFSGEYTLNLRISDQIIKALLWRIITLAACLLLIVTLLFSYVGHESAAGKEDFWLVECSGEKYAVVYNNGEIAVLLRCEFENGNISMDRSQQKIMAVDSLDSVTQWHGKVIFKPIENAVDSK